MSFVGYKPTYFQNAEMVAIKTTIKRLKGLLN